MNVEVNGKTYCVETLIADNERLRKDVIASADIIRLVLDNIKAEIEGLLIGNPWYANALSDVLDIIDKYKVEGEDKE